MGRKQCRRREYLYLYLCLACLISVVVGCSSARPAVTSPQKTLPDRWESLQPVQRLIESRDFEGAMQEYRDILSRPDMKQQDRALFDLGLLYSHYANPRKDFEKSLACFSQILKEHPGSLLREEARIWIHLLETMEKAKRVDIELENKKKSLNR